ncbi:MAG: arginase [Kaistia sp. SCN 65-12]|nr:MAG: arginase [Kaistia sp. SCN 65-12]
MKLSLILAPYDSGRYNAGCGQGPEAIVTGGLVEELTLNGHDVVVEDIGRAGPEPGRETATGFAVAAAVAAKASEAVKAGRFPIVLAGNCLTAVGAVAGEAADSIVWADQHGDLNTPETSTSGFLDGMALSVALGQCWHAMAAAVPGFAAIDPSRCLLVDARDLDAAEKAIVERLPILRAHCADAPEVAERLVAGGARRTHLHLDLDVLDPDVVQANRYTWPGGPDPDRLRQAVSTLAGLLPVVGVTVSAYDPAYDPQGDIPPVVGKLLVEMLGTVEKKT